MITYIHTSILESNAQTVVNTVNTVGVMGKGLASAFKKRYPEMFKRYKLFCEEGKFEIGQLWLWKGPDQWVLNFPTKKHWRNPSKLSYIETGLEKFVKTYRERGIREIAFPRLGCGNGGLEWEKVKPLIEEYLGKLPIDVFIHDYEADIGLPEHKYENKNRPFYRSFDAFIEDLAFLSKKKNGKFHTVLNHTPFTANFNGEKGIVIVRGVQEKQSNISTDDLYEVWNLLLRGLVTSQKLPGNARSEAYYLLALLSGLPYVRLMEVRQRDNQQPTIGIQLLANRTDAETINEDNNQSELSWH